MKGCRQYFKQKQSQYDLSLSASKNAWYLTSAVFEACLASFGTESQGVNFSGGWIRKCFENVKMLLYQFSEIPLIFEINKCSSSSMELENRNRIHQFNCSVWLVVYNTSLFSQLDGLVCEKWFALCAIHQLAFQQPEVTSWWCIPAEWGKPHLSYRKHPAALPVRLVLVTQTDTKFGRRGMETEGWLKRGKLHLLGWIFSNDVN